VSVYCPACRERRQHTAEDWKHHPLAGHGYDQFTGWSFPQKKADLPNEFDPAKPVAVKSIP
jgi:hypothetical protein